MTNLIYSILSATACLLAYRYGRYTKERHNLKRIANLYGLLPRPYESNIAFRNRVDTLTRLNQCSEVMIRSIYGVRFVEPGAPGEIMVVTSWWANKTRVSEMAERHVPAFCLMTVRRETLKEWWTGSKVARNS